MPAPPKEMEKMKLSEDGLTVFDEKTGLTWQRSGSDDPMDCVNAEKYIQKLNRKKFADYNDWRLPARDEAMSILTTRPEADGFFCDLVFDRNQKWILTADKDGAGRAWFVYFSTGLCGHYDVGYSNYVRAVRS